MLKEKCANEFQLFDDDDDGKLDQEDVLAFIDKFWGHLDLGAVYKDDDSDFEGAMGG